MVAYIYIATPTVWGENKNGHFNGFKIGYTTNPARRNNNLRYIDGYTIRQTYTVEVADTYDGTDIEKMVQRVYRKNYKVKQLGNDYFKSSKVTTAKALKDFTEITQKVYEQVMG
jgi:hypothetical protein